jgi:excisionase family DNA binding protein
MDNRTGAGLTMTHERCQECHEPDEIGARGESNPAVLVELQASGRHTCSIDEAAAVLGIGRSTAYAAAHDGSLPTLRLSHRLLVPTARLFEMLGLKAPA